MASDSKTPDNEPADNESDALDLVANRWAEKEKSEREEIVQSNKHGNGFKDTMQKSSAPNQEGTYNPQKLNARHREIIRLHALGYKGVMIAKMLGCTPQTVYNITNSPLGIKLINEIEQARTGTVKEVRDRLVEASPLAAEIVIDVMNEGKKESNKLKAALKLLEMAGQKSDEIVQHNHLHMTKEDIKEIKERVPNGTPAIRSEQEKDFNETNHPHSGGGVQDAEIIEESDE